MYSPRIIIKESFQLAWIDACTLLMRNNWRMRNLMIQVLNPSEFNGIIHQRIFDFSVSNNLLTPKQVAYTIFPHKLYNSIRNADGLFYAYNRKNGFYQRIKRRSRRIRWGTYFRRMTHYETDESTVNQLQKIINFINNRIRISKSTYTIIIQNPENEITQPRGAPCLNFLIVQLEPNPIKALGLFCVYRNQEYLERAYGNFWGLCNLLQFLAKETDSNIGPLTCIISHAYVSDRKQNLKTFIEELS